MKFWDSSAIVALLLQDAGYQRARVQLDDDPAMVVWWATQVECAAALIRREREGRLTGDAARLVWLRLQDVITEWQEVLPSAAVRTKADRMLRVHSLRTADAFQLAAALTAAEGDPTSLDVVCLDGRLNDCAAKEGFRIV